MKIDYKNAEAIIINLVKQNTIKCLVLYGESISSVENKYRLAIDTFKKNSFDISSINPDLMKSNEGFLCEEFLSISMLDGITRSIKLSPPIIQPLSSVGMLLLCN